MKFIADIDGTTQLPRSDKRIHVTILYGTAIGPEWQRRGSQIRRRRDAFDISSLINVKWIDASMMD